MSVLQGEITAARRPPVVNALAPAAPILVQKFGGSSLSTPAKLRAVAERIVAAKRRGYALVAVVSAMGDATDDLLALAREVSASPLARELDALLATGEAVSAALLAMAIQGLGERAVSFSGGACGILTNAVHGNARILEVHPSKVRAALDDDAIVVATGFQGVSAAGEVTTLGRGGSDTSAVALAAALDAERCEIYTDVEGVFSADPRRIPTAQRIESIGSDELEELAWHGAQVVKAEAVEFAADNHVPLLVASTFAGGGGTLIRPSRKEAERFRPRVPEVAGVAGRKDLLRLVVPATLGPARAELLSKIGGYDLVFGALGTPCELYLSTLEMIDPGHLSRELRERCGESVAVEEGLGAVSIVGFGLGSRPAALFDAARCVEAAGGRVQRSFTGRESLTFVLAAEQVDRCVAELHRVYIEKRKDH